METSEEAMETLWKDVLATVKPPDPMKTANAAMDAATAAIYPSKLLDKLSMSDSLKMAAEIRDSFKQHTVPGLLIAASVAKCPHMVLMSELLDGKRGSEDKEERAVQISALFMVLITTTAMIALEQKQQQK